MKNSIIGTLGSLAAKFAKMAAALAFACAGLGATTQVATQADLSTAVANATAGDTVQITAAGTYTLGNIPQGITIEGGVSGVTLDYSGVGEGASFGTAASGTTFKSIDFTMGTSNYRGWQHSSGLFFEDCTFSGKFFSYGDMTFTDCVFTQTENDYHMWIYSSGKVSYISCTFNYIKKCLHVYNEGAQSYNIFAKDCTFNPANASDSGNKGVFNVKNTGISAGVPAPTSVTLILDDCTTTNEKGLLQLESDATDGNTAVAIGSDIVLDANGDIVSGNFTTLYTGSTADQIISTSSSITDNGNGTYTVAFDPYAAYTKVADGFYQNAATYAASTDFYITSKAGLEYFRDLVNGETAASYAYFAATGVTSTYPQTPAGINSFHSNNMFKGKTVHMCEDIDLAGEQWLSIGFNRNSRTITDPDTSVSASVQKCYFYGLFDAGIYDGEGNLTGTHVISNLDSSWQYAPEYATLESKYQMTGLFGMLAGGTSEGVKNLTVSNATVVGRTDVGVIAGRIYNGGAKIENCHVVGDISVAGSGTYVGGLVGECRGSIVNSSVDAAAGSSISGYAYVGGLAGSVFQYNNSASVEVSGSAVSNTTVSASYSGAAGVGALVGVTNPSGTYHGNVVISGNDANDVSVTASNASASSGSVGTLVGCTLYDDGAYAIVADNTVSGTTSATAGGNAVTAKMGAANDNIAVGENVTFDANGEITGGIFEVINDELIAEGYLSTDNLDDETSASYPLTIGGPYEAVIGSTGYATLAAAIAAAQDGDTVTLLQDVSVDTQINLAVPLTVDLNGKTITSAADNRVFKIATTVGDYVFKNGTVNTTSPCYGLFRVDNASTVTVEGITATNDRSWGCNFRIAGGAQVLVTNCTITATNGGGIYAEGGSTVDVYDSTIAETGTATDCNASAFAIGEGATLTVHSGTYSGEYGAFVCSSGGTIEILGGSVTGRTYAIESDARAGGNEDNSVADSLIKVSGGTIDGELHEEIQLYNSATLAYENKMVITGGTFLNYSATGPTADNAGYEISGGSFDSQVLASHCAAGYEPVTEADAETGLYTVQIEEGKVARNVTQNIAYDSLEAAIAAAATGDTVTLLDDYTMTNALNVIGKSLDIDLGGNTLKITANVNRLASGAVTTTIENGVIDISGVGNNSGTAGIFSAGHPITGAANGGNTINLVDVTLTGTDYYGHSVFQLYAGCALNIEDSTVGLTNCLYTSGGFVKSDGSSYVVPITIRNSTIDLVNPQRGVVDGQTVIVDSTIRIVDDRTIAGDTVAKLDNGFNYNATTGDGACMAITNSAVTISGGTGRGITLNGKDVIVADGSTLAISDMGEGDIKFKKGSADNVVTATDDSHVTAGTVVLDSSVTSPASELLIADTTSTVPTFAAQIERVPYATFAEAIAAAEAYFETNGSYPTITVLDATAELSNADWKISDGYLVKKVYVAQIVANDGATTNKYESLLDAYDDSVSGDTIELLADDYSLTGGDELFITHAITITGPVDANGNPLYTIYGSSNYVTYNDIFIKGTTAIDVTIENVKLSNFGDQSSSNISGVPGVIWVSAQTHADTHVVVSNVVISSFNYAAIKMYSGALDVVDCLIDCAKTVPDATTKGLELGAAATVSSVTPVVNVIRTEIINNTCDAYDTGAIEAWQNTKLTVSDCTMTNVWMGIYACGSSFVTGDASGDSVSVTVTNTLVEADAAAIGIAEEGGTTVPSMVSIQSGTFSGGLAISDEMAGYGTIAISGGMFDAPVPEEYCADGFIPAGQDPETGLYTVKAGAYAAQVVSANGATTNKFETLPTAISAATAGDTIQLLTDISGINYQYLTKSVKIDGQGYTITGVGTAVFVLGANAALELSNVTVIDRNTTNGAGGITIVGTGTSVSLDNCTLECVRPAILVNPGASSDITIVDSTVTGYAAIYLYGAANTTVVATDSTLNGVNSWSASPSNAFGTIMVDASDDCTITLTDCTVTGTSTNGNTQRPFVIASNAGVASGNTIAVSGDSTVVTAPDGQDVGDAASGNVIAISGGAFNVAVPEEFCADGYIPATETVVIDGVEYYTVKAGYKAGDMVELDDADRELTATEAAFLNALLDRDVSKATIDSAIGNLSADAFEKAALLNIDITREWAEPSFRITSIRRNAKATPVTVTVTVTLDRKGNEAGDAIYGTVALLTSADGKTGWGEGTGVFADGGDDNFSGNGSTVSFTMPAEGNNRIFKAIVVDPSADGE